MEDDEGVLSLLEAFTEELGHEAVLAHNGAEALEILGIEQVNVIVTDMAMPKMDGLTFAGQVKKEYPGIRIVGISGAVAFRPGGASPFDVFLTKPLDFGDFERAIAVEDG